MGMVLKQDDIEYVKRIADRERALLCSRRNYGDDRFVFEQKDGVKPIDLAMADMFGNSPKTVMKDSTVTTTYKDVEYDAAHIEDYLRDVLSLKA